MTKRAPRALKIERLEEKVGVYGRFVLGMVLERPTYAVVYVLIRERNGHHRITFRGTGQYDDWFEVLAARNNRELQENVALLDRRFRLSGRGISKSVRYYEDGETFVAALPDIEDADDWALGWE